ncbi:hypothetical protein [Jannaschia sp. W003]|uniref:hypothetical protein n=1 Tax=Jannaschia sp. W003 TaxID=2867012 RepID=UPI0021A92FFA|nr:hypothetical protein [Jannaschia sp. W003]UWQ22713.1 hypothetical protein K3554_06725 [Jannaschia sp. W003]
MSIPIPPNDTRVHVFRLRGEGDPIPTQTFLEGGGDHARVRAALGASDVDPAQVEVFAVSDIAPMSVRDYLAQAHDVPQAAMAADGARLDALTGRVMVAGPRALRGVAALEPEAGVEHVGAYGTPVADDSPQAMPRAASEPPRIATPAAAVDEGPRGKTILWVVLAAVAVAVLVVLLL